MADYTGALLKAMSIISENSSGTNSDKTVKASIVSVQSDNQYTASYNGGQIAAYSNNSEKYNIGDLVYVQVPQGNFDNVKYILGLAEIAPLDQEEERTNANILSNYTKVGGNIIINKETWSDADNRSYTAFPSILYCNKVSNYNFCYKKDRDEEDTNPIWVDVDEKSFTNNLNDADSILIKANFLTNLATNASGDYGIIITMNVSIGENTSNVSYILNTEKMLGNPMKFYNGSSQYAIFNFEGVKFNYIQSILLYTSGFVTKDTKDDYGYVKFNNLELYALSKMTSDQDGYCVSITSPNGNSFEKIDDKITLTANVFKDHKETNCNQYIWGINDVSINSKSVDYNGRLGSGYRKINQEEKTIILNIDDCKSNTNTIKCVCVCDENKAIANTINVYNNFNSYNITIKSSQGTNFYISNGSPILTCYINDKDSSFEDNVSDTEFSFVWSKRDDNGEYCLLEKTKEELENEQKVKLDAATTVSDKSLIRADYARLISQVEGISFIKGVNGNILKVKPENVEYCCQVYRNDSLRGSASITLTNNLANLSINSYVFIKNGNQVFQYDENGMSPASDKKKTPLEIKNLEIEFRDPTTNEPMSLDDVTYYWELPQGKSLIKKPDYNINENRFYGKILPLQIEEKYDMEATDNVITATVVYKDSIYKADTNFYFGKVGEPGTNGTNFVAKISPIFSPEDDNKLCFIEQEDGDIWNIKDNNGLYVNASIDFTSLKMSLYQNTQPISENFSKTWSFLGKGSPQTVKEFDIKKETGAITKNNASGAFYNYQTVKGEIKFDGKKYYNYYNIPVLKYSLGYNYSSTPINLVNSKTLNYITYDADNANPQFNSSIGVALKMNKNLFNNSKIIWSVESGPIESGSYLRPNFTISFTKNSKQGGTKLQLDNIAENANNFINSIKNIIAKDDSQNCERINEQFKELLSSKKNISDLISTVRDLLQKIYQEFYLQNAFKWSNISVSDIYNQYNDLINEIETEYNEIEKINNILQNIRNQFSTTMTSYKESSEYIGKLGISYNRASVDSIDQLRKYINNGQTSLLAVNIGKDELAYGEKVVIEKIKSYFLCTELFEKFNGIVEENNDNENNYPIVKQQLDYYRAKIENIKSQLKKDDEKEKSLLELLNEHDVLIKNCAFYFIEKTEQYNLGLADIGVLSQFFKEENNEEVISEIYVIPNEIFDANYSNNNISIKILDDKNEQIAELVVPICFTSNVYSLASINGWDGVGIDINEDGGYILSPQIGAGKKDDVTNTFTGLVMGTLSSDSEKEDKIGLMGFSKGKQSIFMDAKTGNTILGTRDGAKIELIPNGTSTIANWHIGENLLYNTTSGVLHLKEDSDSRFSDNKKRMSIANEDCGIILSSNNPYIHIKGQPIDAKYLSTIKHRTADGYDPIAIGDSLELKLDPNNKSLFSIVQYTDSIDADDMDGLYCGTYMKTSDGVKKVAYGNFDINKLYEPNDTDENGNDKGESNRVFVVYRIKKGSENNYVPYYTNKNFVIKNDTINSFGEDGAKIIKAESEQWTAPSPTISLNHLTGEVTLSNYTIEGTENVTYSETSEDGFSLVSTIKAENTNNFFDCEVGYAESNIPKTWVANNNNKQILLYKFSLSDETTELTISQPLTISSLISDINFEFSLMTEPTEKEPSELLVTSKVYKLSDGPINQIVFSGGKTIPKDKTIGLYIQPLFSENYSYKYKCAYCIKGKIYRDTILPEILSEILNYQEVGQYGDFRKSILYANKDNGLQYKISFGGQRMIITNTSPTKSFSVVGYCVVNNQVVKNSQICQVAAGGIETVEFSTQNYANAGYNWNFVFYDSAATVESLKFSANPQYIITDYYFKPLNDTLLKIVIDMPGNSYTSVPQDADTLCCTYGSLGTIQAEPITETFLNGNKIPSLKIYKYEDLKNKTVIPVIDLEKLDSEELTYVKYLRGFDYSKITGTKEILLSEFSEYSASKEYIKVGLDEKGRFYTSGASQKKTLSKIGPISAFNYFYGNGIEIDSDQVAIGKIFGNEGTTYITGGKNEENALHLLSGKEIKLSLFNTNKIIDQLSPIPPTWTGIDIEQNQIKFTVENYHFVFDVELLSKMDSLFSSLTKEQITKLINLVKTES